LLDSAERWIDLEVDGGISATTVVGATAAGANVLISGSALYRHPEGLGAGVGDLRRLATGAYRGSPAG
jgi:ribulose-phosphate 3-epimerase